MAPVAEIRKWEGALGAGFLSVLFQTLSEITQRHTNYEHFFP